MGSENAAVSRLNGWWGWEQPLRPSAAKDAPAVSGQNAGKTPSPEPVRQTAESQERSDDPPKKAAPLDPALSLHALQIIWGALEIRPGGRAAHIRLAEKLGVNPGETVIETGCGLGGFAAAMASGFGADVIAADRNPATVKEANRLLEGVAYGNQVRFALLKEPNFELPADNAAAAVLREPLSHDADGAALLTEIAVRVRPGGVLALADFFAADELDAPAIADLAPADLAATEAAIEAAGFKLLGTDDESIATAQQIAAAWSAVGGRLEKAPPPLPVLKVLQIESKRWASISAALAGGGLTFKTIVARRVAPAPKVKAAAPAAADSRRFRLPKPSLQGLKKAIDRAWN